MPVQLMGPNFILDTYGFYKALSQENQAELQKNPLLEEAHGSFAVKQNIEAIWYSSARLVASYAFVRFCSPIGCGYHVVASLFNITYGLIYTARKQDAKAQEYLERGMEHVLKFIYHTAIWYFAFYTSCAFAIAPSAVISIQTDIMEGGEEASFSVKRGAKFLSAKLMEKLPPLEADPSPVSRQDSATTHSTGEKG